MSDEEYMVKRLKLAMFKLKSVMKDFQECCECASQQLEQVNTIIGAIEKNLGQEEE